MSILAGFSPFLFPSELSTTNSGTTPVGQPGRVNAVSLFGRQAQQLASTLFQAVLKKEGSRKQLWEHLCALFYTLPFSSLEEIFRALLYGFQIEKVVILGPD